MLKSARFTIRLFAITALLTVVAACEKSETSSAEKGPAEQAGQKLDQAASRAGEELNKAAEVAGKGLQKFGQKIQNEAEQAQQAQPQKKE